MADHADRYGKRALEPLGKFLDLNIDEHLLGEALWYEVRNDLRMAPSMLRSE